MDTHRGHPPEPSDPSDLRAHQQWFDQLYTAAGAGQADVPWDRDGPNPVVAEWLAEHPIETSGRRALVIGCGLGSDSEYLGRLGFASVVAFDFAATAIAEVRRRYPDSPVRYQVADLLDPPPEWDSAFDFVLESLTVQSLHPTFRTRAIERIRRFVAPGGTLLVIASVYDPQAEDSGPPWPLSRAEVESFADGLRLIKLETPHGADRQPRWRAELRREPWSADAE